MAPQPELIIKSQAGGTLEIQLSGDWTLESDIPDTAGLTDKIGSAESVSGINFETKEVTDWDSGLLTFLVEVTDYCRKKKVNIDPAGLPDGVEKLLHLAYAVPERKGARRETSKRSFLYNVGMDAMDGIRTMGEFTAFLGASVIALGAFVRGKAVYQRSELWRIIQVRVPRPCPSSAW